MAVTPVPGNASEVVTGGVSVVAILAGPNGGFITNPSSAADQGIGTAEVLYVDPTGASPGSTAGSANGTAFALQPGQSWPVVPGQSTQTKVNAATSGHKFTCVVW